MSCNNNNNNNNNNNQIHKVSYGRKFRGAEGMTDRFRCTCTGCGKKKVIPCRIFQIFKQQLRVF